MSAPTFQDRLASQQPFTRMPCSQCHGKRGDYTCKECDGFGITLQGPSEHNWRWAGMAIALGLLLAWLVLIS